MKESGAPNKQGNSPLNTDMSTKSITQTLLLPLSSIYFTVNCHLNKLLVHYALKGGLMFHHMNGSISIFTKTKKKVASYILTYARKKRIGKEALHQMTVEE